MSAGWIYIVEDDESIREMEQYALENSGFRAKGFGGGKEFFSACEQELPGLVILDIMLAGEDGLAILKVLRASPKTRSIPVMMVILRNISAGGQAVDVVGIEGIPAAAQRAGHEIPGFGKPAFDLFICHGFPSSREPLIKSARADSERFFTR